MAKPTGEITLALQPVKFGTQWHVVGTYPGGQQEHITGFKTEAGALDWIANDSAAWFADQGQGPGPPSEAARRKERLHRENSAQNHGSLVPTPTRAIIIITVIAITKRAHRPHSRHCSQGTPRGPRPLSGYMGSNCMALMVAQ
jgi:hypothetical protein